MPDHAPEAKVRPTQGMGAEVTKVPFDSWWKVIVEKKFEDWKGAFIHPVSEQAVIAGGCEVYRFDVCQCPILPNCVIGGYSYTGNVKQASVIFENLILKKYRG